MLLILAFSLVIASVFLIIYRKNKDSILWLGLCTSLMLELCGVMLFIAKKGGISQEVLTFLYFSRNIYRKMQYFLITLGQLGYDCHRQGSVSVFFAEDCNELFNASGT